MVNGSVYVEMMNMRSKNLILVIILMSFIFALSVEPNNSVVVSKFESSVEARADCPTVNGADTLTLDPPGPFALPAHQTVVFHSSIEDSSGAGINSDPLWGVTNGTITPVNGFEQATFTPHSTGDVTVWACVDGINTTASVTVVQGAVDQLLLESSSENITADDTITFSLTEVDIRGNSATASPPLNNWTLPEDSDLDLGTLMWTPKHTGHHVISVNYGGVSAYTDLNVSHGKGIAANISTPKSTLSSDESVVISLELSDSKGNKWIVDGDWSLTDPGASQSWLDKNGTNVTFNANTVGSWVVQATYDGIDSTSPLIDLHTFIVTPGSLFQIIIEGNGVTMTVDEELDLDPKLYDFDMNELTGIPIIWEVNGDIKTIDLESTNFIFSTEYIGQYEIQASAGDKYASIIFDVTYGSPIALQIIGEESSAIVVRSGDTALVYVEAVDQYGNAFPVDVEWSHAEDTGSFKPDSKGNGWYLYEPGELQGFIIFNATYEDIYHDFIIDVQQGSASQLLISFDGDLAVGNSVQVTVYAIDSTGSKIAECDSSSITGDLTSTAGTFSMEENKLYLNIEESGQQHKITITCLGMEETTFFDVQSSLFGGVFGSSNSAILTLSLIVMFIIAALLFVIMRRSTEQHYDEDYDEEDEPAPSEAPPSIAFSQTPPPLPIPQAPTQLAPPATMIPPPLPHPPLPQTTPSSSIGQGLVAPSIPGEPPQTAEGVWIQPQTDYGWNEQQSPMFVNEPALGGYGWEGNTQSLPSAPPESENKLSNALSNLGPMNQTEDTVETTTNVIETSTNTEELESEVGNSEIRAKNDDVVEPIEQIKTENKGPEEITKTIEDDSDDDGWGSWDTDNWGSQDWKDKAKERAIEESKKDDYDRGGSHTQTMPVFEHVIGGRDSIGPLDDFGKVMSPLPGTNVGTSGWYLGSDGSPSQWEFRPQGWKKIQ